MNHEEILTLLDERIKQIARSVFVECFAEARASAPSSDDKSAKLREQFALIKAKEQLTVKEVALLVSCSESDIRKNSTARDANMPRTPGDGKRRGGKQMVEVKR
jgi:hypothetical protein